MKKVYQVVVYRNGKYRNHSAFNDKYAAEMQVRRLNRSGYYTEVKYNAVDLEKWLKENAS